MLKVMKMKKTVATVLLSAGLIGSAMLSAAMAAPSEGRERLNNFFTKVNTMQSTFVQEVYDDKGTLKQNSKGTVYLVRPGRFRWEYTSPEAHKIISDGKNVWAYDVELDQVTVKPMSNALASAPVGMLTKKQPVDKQFAVQEMQAEDGNSALDWFRLTPHKKDSDFTIMDLGVDKTGIKEMVLSDKFGQKTYIKFTGMATNIQIAPARFQFTPPQGVDVIGNPS